MLADWPVIAPHVILALVGVLVFCLGAFWKNRPGDLLWWLALVAAAAAGLAALGGPQEGAYGGLLDVGTYGRFLTGLLSLLTVLTLLVTRRYAAERGFAGEELYGLVLMAALGMVLTAGAVHWLVFFLGLELLSICLYVLIAMRRGVDESLEAGLKYFILGAVAGSLVVFGIAMLYAGSGSLLIPASLAAIHGQGNGALTLVGLGLLLGGLAFKLSLAPLHVWTPDVYQGAPAPVTAFLAAGSKTAVMAVIIRISAMLPDAMWAYWLLAIWGLAALTMLVTNLSALREDRVKRLLAYSSAAQMGYLLMSVTGAGHGGLSAALFFLTVYGFMDLGVFGLMAVVSPADRDLNRLGDLNGLARTFPWRAGFLVLLLLSLAGMPPTGGFVGKLLLFSAALKAGHAFLAFLGALAAATAFYYYFKVVAALYMRAPEDSGSDQKMGRVIAPAEILAFVVIAVIILWLGLFPAWLQHLSQVAAVTLAG